MWILYQTIEFFFNCPRMQIKTCLLRFGCYFISSWHFIDNDNVCTTGKVLKLNKIYTYTEDGSVDIVRLTDVHIERGYLYCSLYFFSRNQIITVRQTMLKGAHIIWRLSDNKEFDEILSMKLWQGIEKQDELLEFDF